MLNYINIFQNQYKIKSHAAVNQCNLFIYTSHKVQVDTTTPKSLETLGNVHNITVVNKK